MAVLSRIRRSRMGRAWIRLLSTLGETVWIASASVFLVSLLLLVILVWFLWFFTADQGTIGRFAIVADAISAFALIALTFVLLMVEARRDRAEFFIDEANIHKPPDEDNPDELAIAFRVVNVGGRESVVWQSKSYVNAFDQLGSKIRLDAWFWPYDTYFTDFPEGFRRQFSKHGAIGPGTVRDFVAQVNLSKALDAGSDRLELVVKPAIGPPAKRSVKVEHLQAWLDHVRRRHGWP